MCIVHYFIHYPDFYECVQKLVISSNKVKWVMQATCILVDNEPAPPKNAGYQADKGWKEINTLVVKAGGGNFLIPKDQLLAVTDKGYMVIKSDENRVLSKLSGTKNYLFWYHHLFAKEEWEAKQPASKHAATAASEGVASHVRPKK